MSSDSRPHNKPRPTHPTDGTTKTPKPYLLRPSQLLRRLSGGGRFRSSLLETFSGTTTRVGGAVLSRTGLPRVPKSSLLPKPFLLCLTSDMASTQSSRIPATPNHALQRTAPCVTAPASTAAFPPAMQVPRRTPQSLSLGSLGVSRAP